MHIYHQTTGEYRNVTRPVAEILQKELDVDGKRIWMTAAEIKAFNKQTTGRLRRPTSRSQQALELSRKPMENKVFSNRLDIAINALECLRNEFSARCYESSWRILEDAIKELEWVENTEETRRAHVVETKYDFMRAGYQPQEQPTPSVVDHLFPPANTQAKKD